MPTPPHPRAIVSRTQVTIPGRHDTVRLVARDGSAPPRLAAASHSRAGAGVGHRPLGRALPVAAGRTLAIIQCRAG